MKRFFKLLFTMSILCVTFQAFADTSIRIMDMKTAQNIDEKYQPVNPLSNFPPGTAKIYCWFKWKDAQPNSQITARWTYVTERLPILDYNVAIPRREGSGGVAFSMPPGKNLPPGEYEVRLESDKRIVLKSVRFKVSAK